MLEGLNDKQYEAVINPEGPNLIIAGAAIGIIAYGLIPKFKEKNHDSKDN
mgnify:CR=1 FL=1